MEPVRAGVSVGQVFAFVAGFIALAAIGATIGWTVTKSPTHKVAVSTSTSPSGQPTTSTTEPAHPPTPTPVTTPTNQPAGSFTIPDYASAHADFMTARSELMSKKLGVTLVFDGPLDGTPDGTVTQTTPASGVAVARGTTVKVFVSGNPPPLAVPGPNGAETCKAFGKRLAAAGFLVTYSPSSQGLVAAADPGFGQSSQWNATVNLTCTADGTLPAPPPSSGGASGQPPSPPTDTQPSE